MGFSRHFSKECNFILTKVTGEINDEDLAAHVKAINSDASGSVNVKGLADCREITKVSLTTQGTISCAESEDNKPGSKIVILVPEDNELIFAMARAYKMFCENQYEAVEILRNYDAALSWLANNDQQEIKTLDDYIKSV